MLRKVKVSMKVKILALLISLLMISLSVYVFVALDMFATDKTAYIYETGLSTAESLSEQVQSILGHASQRSYTLALSGKTNRRQQQKLVDLDDSLLMYGILSRKGGRIGERSRTLNKRLITNLTKDKEISPDFFAEIAALDYFKIDKLNERPFVVYDGTDIFKIPALVLLISNDKLEEYYVSVLSLNKLTAQFTKDLIYDNAMLDFEGSSYIGQQDQNKGVTRDYGKEEYISKILKSSLAKGTMQVTSLSGEEKIVAYNKLVNFGLLVVSEISKEKAFSASRNLMRKSVLFGIMLIGLAVFIGVLFSISLTRPISELLKGTQEVANGNFTDKTEVKSNDELGVLSDSFNIMSDKIVELMDQTAQAARMEKELETAQTVQETLFPELNADFGSIALSGYYQPASECGGDWWYYSDTKDYVYLWIGDATGHGVPAALITSAARSAASIIEGMEGISPSNAMALLNNSICDTSKGKILMTFFLGRFNKNTKELIYANASQNPPFHFKFTDEELKVKSFMPLDEVNGPRLGQEKDANYEEASLKLSSDDAIFFYTDGITELEDEKTKQWGERKFIKSVINGVVTNDELEPVINSVLEDVNNYRGNADLADDITMYMVKIS